MQSILKAANFKTRILFLFTIISGIVFSLIYLSIKASAPGYVIQETQLTANGANQNNPSIYENKVVFQDYRNGNWDIYLYDLLTKQETQLTKDLAHQEKPVIYKDKVVFMDSRHGAYNVFLYDLTSGRERQISNGQWATGTADIYENTIVWEDTRNRNSDVYLYDLNSGQERRITSNTSDQYSPKIFGNKIVWDDRRGDGRNVYMFDLSTNAESKITSLDALQTSPHIFEDKIVWEDTRHNYNNPAIYMYDLKTQTEKRITSSSAQKVSLSDFRDNKILWSDLRNGNLDVFMYDLISLNETQITNNLANQSMASVFGDTIVWADSRNDKTQVNDWDVAKNFDIYLGKLVKPTPVPSPTPAPTAIPTQGNVGTNTVETFWATDNPNIIKPISVIEPRSAATAVSNGESIIVWGGASQSTFNDGAIYNIANDSWKVISKTNAPSDRVLHTAVLGGGEMIVWGGIGQASELGDGARYNPATDTWAPISRTSAPVARRYHTAVWDYNGGEMIIWGGFNNNTLYNDGARYNPKTNTWRPISKVNAPVPRYFHTSIWTGSEMIIWGGASFASGSGFTLYNDGARYNPATDTWTPISTEGAPAGRIYDYDAVTKGAVWNGDEMMVWGGRNFENINLNDGAKYNPSTNKWTTLPTAGAPSARNEHSTVWDGRGMIVWGGRAGSERLNSGAIYDNVKGVWSPINQNNAPISRNSHVAVWTAKGMIIWGGRGSNPDFPDSGGLLKVTYKNENIAPTVAPIAPTPETTVDPTAVPTIQSTPTPIPSRPTAIPSPTISMPDKIILPIIEKVTVGETVHQIGLMEEKMIRIQGNEAIFIEGKIKPENTVSISIPSLSVKDEVKAEADGSWKYNLPKNLESGAHVVKVSIKNEGAAIVETQEGDSFILKVEKTGISRKQDPPKVEMILVNQKQITNKVSTNVEIALSDNLSINGKANPDDLIHVYIPSQSFKDTTVADRKGKWKYVLAKRLSAGEYDLGITSQNPKTKEISKVTPMKVMVKGDSGQKGISVATSIGLLILFLGFAFILFKGGLWAKRKMFDENYNG